LDLLILDLKQIFSTMRKLLIPACFSLLFIGCTSTSIDAPVVQISGEDSASLPPEPTVEIVETEYTTSLVNMIASDGLRVFGDAHLQGNENWMLLCHQAGFSRGEYINTAPLFCERGYNSLALDQRSGSEANGIVNMTHHVADSLGLGTSYREAIPDIEAGIEYAYRNNNYQPIILVGSSYSASLVLQLGNNDLRVKAVISFSPGEYYEGESVAGWASGLSVPVFITSSKSEGSASDLLGIVAAIEATNERCTHFVPQEEGIHGSRALWESTSNNEEYWKALDAFLESLD